MSPPATAADPTQIGLDDPVAGDASSSAGEPAVGWPPTDRREPTPTELSEQLIAVGRAAAVEEAGRADLVGDYLGAVADDEVAVSAAFAAADRGYRGWYWSVTVAVVEPERPTISEVVLLPGEQALLAPPWVPWDRRIRPGDVGAGDLLPTAPDDIRLVPGYVDSDDPAVREVAQEFGFGRTRVLSREGRDDAAQRWHDGPFGPDDAVAAAAQANCVTCGFYVPLAGLLGMALGACTNEFSPADGRVVDAQYGCGAHSDTVIDAPLISASSDSVVDEFTLEVHHRAPRATIDPAGPDEVGTRADEIVAAEIMPPEIVADEIMPTEFMAAEAVARLDPAPEAEPDLLLDVMRDPVLDALVEVEADLGWDVAGDPAPDTSVGADPEREPDVDGPGEVAWTAIDDTAPDRSGDEPDRAP